MTSQGSQHYPRGGTITVMAARQGGKEGETGGRKDGEDGGGDGVQGEVEEVRKIRWKPQPTSAS